MNFELIRNKYCLHYLFIPLINQHLEQFINAYNNHSLSSVPVRKTPMQLVLDNDHLNAAVEVIIPHNETVEDELNDEISDNDEINEDELHEEDNDIPQVHINSVNCPLNQNQKTQFENLVVPLQINILNENSTIYWEKLNHALQVFDLITQ